jgi:hypothetical protein
VSTSKHNAIAFCLWGTNPLYTVGAVRNAELMPRFYPGWRMVCWCAEDVPFATLDQLKKLEVDVRPYDPVTPNGMLQRFLIADEPAVDRFLVRDTDSRFTERERIAVDEWIASCLPFHVIRDHPHHSNPMMAGTWGGTTGHLPSMRKLISSHAKAAIKGTRNQIYDLDQRFLARHIWPLIQADCLAHDSCCRAIFPDAQPFPARYGDWRFVGEVIDEHDQPRAFDWEMRLNWMTP